MLKNPLFPLVAVLYAGIGVLTLAPSPEGESGLAAGSNYINALASTAAGPPTKAGLTPNRNDCTGDRPRD